MTPVTSNTTADPIEMAPSRLVQVGCTRRVRASARVRLRVPPRRVRLRAAAARLGRSVRMRTAPSNPDIQYPSSLYSDIRCPSQVRFPDEDLRGRRVGAALLRRLE